MITKDESTAHLDGYRICHEYNDDDDHSHLKIKLYAGGKIVPDFDVDIGAILSSESNVNQDRVAIVAEAVCRFFNCGGSPADLFRIVDVFCTKAAPLKSPYELITVMTPSAGMMMIWQKSPQEYLRVVDGSDGFVESLSESEVKDILVESAEKGAPSEDDETGDFLG